MQVIPCAYCGFPFSDQEMRAAEVGSFPIRLRIACSVVCSESIRKAIRSSRKGSPRSSDLHRMSKQYLKKVLHPDGY